MEKILRLNLKAKWYLMIEEGIKKEEYRELKEYWRKRIGYKTFSHVEFVYGYTKRSMLFEINSIDVRTGREEWGAIPDENYYVISIGKRVR